MQTQNPILDDLAHLASGAAGIAAGIKAEVETQLRQRIERWLSELDLVPREEFEAVKDMAAKARAEQETMAQSIESDIDCNSDVDDSECLCQNRSDLHGFFLRPRSRRL